MGCLWWLLDRRMPSIDTRGVLRSALATAAAALPAAALAWLLARALTVPGANAWHRALPGAGASLAFAVIFLGTAYLMKHTELVFLLRAVRRRRG
jgi:hypothetical protein